MMNSADENAGIYNFVLFILFPFLFNRYVPPHYQNRSQINKYLNARFMCLMTEIAGSILISGFILSAP